MTTPFRVRGIDHVVIRANNVGVMVRFYSEVLGCVLERADPDIGLYQLRAGRSLVDLVDMRSELGRAGGGAPGLDGRNMDHLCLGVEPFDEANLRQHLESRGVASGKVFQRYGAEGQGPSMYIEDPEHNIVELKGPPA